jgi:hypothetical protein
MATTDNQPSITDRILARIEQNPGSKAVEIARALGIDRSAVNSALYGKLRPGLVQDKE